MNFRAYLVPAIICLLFQTAKSQSPQECAGRLDSLRRSQVFQSNYFFAQSAIPVKDGLVELKVINLFNHSAKVNFLSNFSFKASSVTYGFTPRGAFLGLGVPNLGLELAAKFQTSSKWHFGVITGYHFRNDLRTIGIGPINDYLYLRSYLYNHSTLSFLSTYGDHRRNLTLGIGFNFQSYSGYRGEGDKRIEEGAQLDSKFFYKDEGSTFLPTAQLSGVYFFSKRMAVMTENFVNTTNNSWTINNMTKNKSVGFSYEGTHGLKLQGLRFGVELAGRLSLKEEGIKTHMHVGLSARILGRRTAKADFQLMQ